MSTLNLNLLLELFDDASFSNALQKSRIDYSLNESQELETDFRLDIEIPASTTQSIPLPTGTYSFLFILTNQAIAVKPNALATNEVNVSPTVAGTQDGLLLKRGTLTTLSVTNLSATDPARVFILVAQSV